MLVKVLFAGVGRHLAQPEQLRLIGERLLSIPHVQRFRFATKGLAVCPMRVLDKSDAWSDTFIALSDQGRQMGKQVG